MNKEKIKELIKIIEEEQHTTNLDIMYYIDEYDLLAIEDVNQLKEYFEVINEDRYITDEDVIYFNDAMNYLQENDVSLIKSISIATDLGYSLQNLNSEVLASLLKSQNNMDEFNDLVTNIINRAEDLFNEDNL